MVRQDHRRSGDRAVNHKPQQGTAPTTAKTLCRLPVAKQVQPPARHDPTGSGTRAEKPHAS